MAEKSRKQIKEEERKAARKAEKAAKKAANVAKVEATKAEKEAAKAKKATTPKKVEDNGPVVRTVTDVWEALDLERKGIHVNANGEYVLNDNRKQNTNSGNTVSKRRGRRNVHKRGHKYQGRVCVITAKGDHVRVTRTMAKTLVAEGGRYIPKHMYEGKVNGESVDWSKKKGKKNWKS